MARFPRAWLFALSALLAACSVSTDLTLRVVVSGPEGQERPLAKETILLLPFDIDQVYSALIERNHPGPRPDPGGISARRREYDQTYQAYQEALDQAETLRGRAQQIRDTKSTAYRRVFREFQRANAVKNQRLERYNEIAAEFTKLNRTFEDSLVAWRERAYAGFGALSDSLAGTRKVLYVSTDSTGTVVEKIPKGEWWVYLTYDDPANPYQVLRWNVPLTLTGGEREVLLIRENAEARSRALKETPFDVLKEI